jgi:hypothetical protein
MIWSYLPSVDILWLVSIWVLIFAISWLIIFVKVFWDQLNKAKTPGTKQHKAMSEIGDTLIDDMYPKIKAKWEADSGEFLNKMIDNIDMNKAMEKIDFEPVIVRTVQRIDFDNLISRGKDRLRTEMSDFVDKLHEPPKFEKIKKKGPDGEIVEEEIVVFNNEQRWMQNMLASTIQFAVGMIPYVIKKNPETGKWDVPEEVKYASEFFEDLTISRITLIMNKLKGQFSTIADKIPEEYLNNPELISTIADGGLPNIDAERLVPILGEKDAGKLGAIVELAPDLIKLYQVFQGFQGKGFPPVA